MSTTVRDLLGLLARGGVPDEIPDDCPDADALRDLVGHLRAIRTFAVALAEGDLASTTTARGPTAGGLKALQASLRHLTWQTQRVAAGDFGQRVAFMGDFSAAFNAMVERLEESRRALEEANERLRREVAEHVVTEHALRRREAEWRFLAGNADDLLWRTDTTPAYTFASPSSVTLLGVPPDELVGQALLASWPPEPVAALRTLVASAERGGGQETFRAEVLQAGRDGRQVWTEVSAVATFDDAGRVSGTLGLSRGIAARKDEEAMLRRASRTDALTGVGNRLAYESALDEAKARGTFPLTVLAADLDGLKRVNDGQGHEAGDGLLRRAAAVLRGAVREGDLVARVGGDEFTILLPGVDLRAADLVIERVRRREREASTSDGPAVALSLGASVAADAAGLDEALREADALMYADKARRKGL